MALPLLKEKGDEYAIATFLIYSYKSFILRRFIHHHRASILWLKVHDLSLKELYRYYIKDGIFNLFMFIAENQKNNLGHASNKFRTFSSWGPVLF